MTGASVDRIRAAIRDIPDFPKPGILFKDITPVLGDASLFADVIGVLGDRYRGARIDKIAAMESRGFIFGAPVAAQLGLPFVPVRKPGKLPAARMSVEYSLEYGENQLDIHEDAFTPGTRVFIVDDLLATGGTARAAAKLAEMLGGIVAGFGFVIELGALDGRERLDGYAVSSLLTY